MHNRLKSYRKELTMALVLRPKYPIPDRSHQPVQSKSDGGGVSDIGWCEGVLSDGRAFRAEMWAQDQISMLTIFFSALGFEELGQDALRALIQSEGLLTFRGHSPGHCASSLIKDDAASKMWAVNIVIGDEDDTFVTDAVPIFPYSKINEPNTLFNPTPIKAAQKCVS